MSDAEDRQAEHTGDRSARVDDVRFQAAVLRYCECVLRERSVAGERAWLWRIKGKIARYCRRSLERSSPQACERQRTLSQGEVKEVLRTHPLLNEESGTPSLPKRQSDWMEQLRRSVRDIAERLHRGETR